jgi:hypothetical protein
MSITVSAIRRAICFTSSVTALILLFSGSLALAQSDPGMYKTESISAFAGFLYDHQDYTGGYNDGVMFGMDFTQHIHFPVEPSLEARVNIAPGDDIKQNSYMFGPVLNARVGPFRPYGDFLIGLGTINFNHPAYPTYTHDTSTVYDFGGGVEVALVRGVRLKFDMQYQHWQLGTTNQTAFTPVLASAGLAYTIPFRAFHKQSDPAYR